MPNHAMLSRSSTPCHINAQNIYISEQQESLVVAAAVACADFVQPDVLHCQSSDGKRVW